MIIRVEPREFMMYSVYLIFDEEAPDAEDEAVRSYLTEHGLAPKRQSKTRWEDRDSEVIQFGGCYLGRHLDTIAEIQRNVVEREMLAAEMSRLLREGPYAEARDRVSAMTDDDLGSVLNLLVEEYHQESSFGPDGDAGFQVTLDASMVQESLLKLAAADPGRRNP